MKSAPLALAFALVGSLVSPAAAADCAVVPYEVTINILSPRATLDSGLNQAALDRATVKSARPGFNAKGLTEVNYEASYTTEYESVTVPGGGWCSRVRKVIFRFGFATPPAIHISPSLKVGGCLYEEIVEHEHQHLAIALDTLEAGRKWLDNAARIVVDAGGVVGPTADIANKELQARLTKMVNRITTQLYLAADTRNQIIDTTASYLRLGQACR